MKKTLLLTLCCLLSWHFQLLAQQEVTDYGDIPKSRIAASGWHNFKWDGSGSWQTVDVTKKGVLPNKSNDMAPAIEKMINEGSGKRIFKFPAGTFHIKSALSIPKSDVQIIGSGKSTRFILAGGSQNGFFNISGSKTGNYRLAQSLKRGDNKIQLTTSSGLSVGDFVFVSQQGGDRVGDTESQIVKIVAKSGNTLTIDMKMGIPFNKSKARVEELNMKKNVKLSNFYIERTATTNGKSDNIVLSNCQNVEVSFIESKRARNSHLQAFRIRDVLIYGTNFYGNFGGGGGYQYGVKINFSTRVYVINNKASDLRHHYATQFGTDHCVIAYNRANPPYNSYSDFGQHNSKGSHNNLFEGNFGRELFDDPNRKGWGTRHTMWFRNYAIRKLGSAHNEVEWMSIVGNEVRQGDNAIYKGPGNRNPFIAANQINTSREGGAGTMRWGALNGSSKIPASLFLKNRPTYVSRWPLYGPDASSGNPSPNKPPTLSFATPSGNTSVQAGYNKFEVTVNASDTDGSVSSVRLYVDNQLVREEVQAPYTWGMGDNANELVGLSVGSHIIKAEATDDDGAKASKTITLTVNSNTANQPPNVVFTMPTGNHTVTEGYDMEVVVNATDTDGSIAHVILYRGNTLVRQESKAPYEWGHSTSPNPDEVNGLPAGTYTFKAVATDDKGATGEATFVLTVKTGNSGGGPGHCTFGAPMGNGLSAMDKVSYDFVHVLGTGGPALSNFRQLTINWVPQNNGLYQFAINTNNGSPDWFVDFKESMSFQLRNAQPEVTLNNTGFSGLDGNYWVTMDGDNFVLVSKSNPFTLYFSKTSQAPNCSTGSKQAIKNLATTSAQFNIYPNPAQSTLMVHNLAAAVQRIAVYNAQGKMVLAQQVSEEDSEAQLDLGGFRTGVYVLKLIGQEGAVLKTSRFVKDK